MAQTKVLFISQEMTPYLAASPRAELGRLLPSGIAEKGFEVRTFMPKYGAVNERRNQLHEVIRLSGLNIPIDDNDHPLIIKVATLLPIRMQVYFIDSEDYFNPTGADGLETTTLAADNDERMMFFVRGVIETVKKLRWEPAIIQCDGWLTALAPLYLKEIYGEDPSFRKSRIIYTLHSDSFPGTLHPRFTEKLALENLGPKELKALKGLKEIDYKALTHLAIDNADAIVVADDQVDSQLIAYAKATGKPLVPYPGAPEKLPQAVLALYDTLL